jgi:hypothetical protein
MQGKGYYDHKDDYSDVNSPCNQVDHYHQYVTSLTPIFILIRNGLLGKFHCKYSIFHKIYNIL